MGKMVKNENEYDRQQQWIGDVGVGMQSTKQWW